MWKPVLVAAAISVAASTSVGHSDSLDRLPAELASIVHEIQHACGSSIISVNQGHSRYVHGTHRVSLHKLNKAVDVKGNPGCIYSHLVEWPGGVSTDYAAVRHVHISYAPGSHEWGHHFVHGGHRHHRRHWRHWFA